MPAAEDDDVGAVHDDDEERTYRAGLVVRVAAWSSRWRQRAAGRRVRRRHGGAWLRAREDPAGAESQPGRVGAGRATSRPWVIWPISVHGGTRGATRARRVSAAAASAVSASPSRVGCGASPARTSRSTRASQATAWARSHSTCSGRGRRGSSAAPWTAAGRAGRRSAGSRYRGRWPAARRRSRRWCRPSWRRPGTARWARLPEFVKLAKTICRKRATWSTTAESATPPTSAGSSPRCWAGSPPTRY